MARADFQELTRNSPFPLVCWSADFSFRALPAALEEFTKTYNLDLEPDFQRAHVWTQRQQAEFIEYMLAGGPSGRELYFACEGWNTAITKTTRMVIVDGKQRLTAVMAFVQDKLPVRGKLLSEWTGVMRETTGARFRCHVADIDRKATLKWYLALNTGGTPHTDEEITRVRRLLDSMSE